MDNGIKGLIGELYQEAGLLNPSYIGKLRHIIGVAHVGMWLATLLQKKKKAGITPDMSILELGLYLHDIGTPLTNPGDLVVAHVHKGMEFLRDKVDPKIVEIIRKHAIWTLLDVKIPPLDEWTIEEEIVLLADMCCGAHIMSFKERVADVLKRYGGEIPKSGAKWLQENIQEIRDGIVILLPSPTPSFLF